MKIGATGLTEIVGECSVIQIVEILWIVVEGLRGELEEMEIDGWGGAVGAVGPFSVGGIEGGSDLDDGLEDTVDGDGGAEIEDIDPVFHGCGVLVCGGVAFQILWRDATLIEFVWIHMFL